MKPTITGASSVPALPQNLKAWEMGREHGRKASKACPFPPGTDNALAYWSGFIEGKAERGKPHGAK